MPLHGIQEWQVGLLEMRAKHPVEVAHRLVVVDPQRQVDGGGGRSGVGGGYAAIGAARPRPPLVGSIGRRQPGLLDVGVHGMEEVLVDVLLLEQDAVAAQAPPLVRGEIGRDLGFRAGAACPLDEVQVV